MTVTIERDGRRVYFVGDTYAARDQIKAMGGKWDADRKAWWVGSGRAAEAEKLVAELAAAPPAPESLDDRRVYAKVSYKGRQYYVVGETADRCRLTVLDGSIVFWCDKSACELVKTYEGRERWNGRRGSSSAQVLVYPTLKSLRDFRDRQADPATARGQCTECGTYGPRGDACRDCHEGTHV